MVNDSGHVIYTGLYRPGEITCPESYPYLIRLVQSGIPAGIQLKQTDRESKVDDSGM